MSESIIAKLANYNQKEGENFFAESIPFSNSTHATYVLDNNCIISATFTGDDIERMLIRNNAEVEKGDRLSYGLPTLAIYFETHIWDIDVKNLDTKALATWLEKFPIDRLKKGFMSKLTLDEGAVVWQMYPLDKKNVYNFLTGNLEEVVLDKPSVTKKIWTVKDGTIDPDYPDDFIFIDYDSAPIEKIQGKTDSLYLGRHSEEEEWIGEGHINKTIFTTRYSGVMIEPSKENKGCFVVSLAEASDNEAPYIVYQEEIKSLEKASTKFSELCGSIENKHIGSANVEFIKLAAVQKAKDVFSSVDKSVEITDSKNIQHKTFSKAKKKVEREGR